MKEIISNTGLIAYCGLYCGACPRYIKDKCPGCRENEKATWCGVRKCCIANNLQSCAGCSTHRDVMACRSFNNFMSKIFGFIFRSDRKACIEFIRQDGYQAFADAMTERKSHSIRR